MGTIFQAQKQYAALDIEEIAAQTILENQEQMLNDNRQQLAYGLDSDEVEITSGKIPSLYIPSAFYNSLYINSEFKINSDITYATDLANKYGPHIYGISETNAQKYRQILIAKIKDRIK